MVNYERPGDNRYDKVFFTGRVYRKDTRSDVACFRFVCAFLKVII